MHFKKYILIALIPFLSTTICAEKLSLDIQHWDLPNKTHVYFVRRAELPMLDVQLVLNAGSVQDKDQNGIAVLTNGMIGEGAKGLSADQIAKNFENVGAQYSQFANRDMSVFSLRTLIKPNYLNAALTNFSHIILFPTFPEKELLRVKQQITASLKSEEQDPSSVAMNQFYKKIYEHSAYAHNPLGSVESIAALTPAALTHFYQQHYVGANADLILVGDISTEQAKKIATEIAGQLPQGQAAPTLPVVKNTEKPDVITINFPSTQSTILIGQVGIMRQNPDYFSLMVGNAVFGGLPMSSILYDQVREKRGLAYSVGSFFDAWQYRGPFIVNIQTKNASANESKKLVLDLLKQFVATGPTESQLAAAKKNLVGSFPLSLSSNRGILGALTNIAFYHRPLNYFDTYTKNIETVSASDVKKAFEKNIDANKLMVVTVGGKQ